MLELPHTHTAKTSSIAMPCSHARNKYIACFCLERKLQTMCNEFGVREWTDIMRQLRRPPPLIDHSAANERIKQRILAKHAAAEDDFDDDSTEFFATVNKLREHAEEFAKFIDDNAEFLAAVYKGQEAAEFAQFENDDDWFFAQVKKINNF